MTVFVDTWLTKYSFREVYFYLLQVICFFPSVFTSLEIDLESFCTMNGKHIPGNCDWEYGSYFKGKKKVEMCVNKWITYNGVLWIFTDYWLKVKSASRTRHLSSMTAFTFNRCRFNFHTPLGHTVYCYYCFIIKGELDVGVVGNLEVCGRFAAGSRLDDSHTATRSHSSSDPRAVQSLLPLLRSLAYSSGALGGTVERWAVLL